MLFHRTIAWRDWFDWQSRELLCEENLVLSKHLWQHIDEGDNKHDISLEHLYIIVNTLKTIDFTPFEVETDICENVTKFVVRVEYDNERDISIVVRSGIIVSAWLNYKSDYHETLNRDKYEIC